MLRFIKITDIQDPAVDPYERLSEPQLYHYYEPEPGIFIVENLRLIERALHAGYEPVSVLLSEKLLRHGTAQPVLALMEELMPKDREDLPVYTADEEIMSAMSGFSLTRGALCAMRRRPLPSVEEVCSSAKRIAVLVNIENPTNTGAIFRSAAALGADAVLLAPPCSDPLQRRAARVSMGTVFQVPWAVIPAADWPEKTFGTFAKLGFKSAALALKEDSITLDAPVLKTCDRLAILLGNENYGLPDEVLSLSDHTVIIPMGNGVDSLNVAAAAAVAFWELRRRN